MTRIKSPFLSRLFVAHLFAVPFSRALLDCWLAPWRGTDYGPLRRRRPLCPCLACHWGHSAGTWRRGARGHAMVSWAGGSSRSARRWWAGAAWEGRMLPASMTRPGARNGDKDMSPRGVVTRHHAPPTCIPVCTGQAKPAPGVGIKHLYLRIRIGSLSGATHGQLGRLQQ
jgi:hypothetical protein